MNNDGLNKSIVGKPERLLIVGETSDVSVGTHFKRAAEKLKIEVRSCDMREAYKGPYLFQKMNQWIRDREPLRLQQFSEKLIQTCRAVKPRMILCTGITPLDGETLSQIGQLGVLRVNYLTDDPWNPSHRSNWFMESLSYYDCIFTVRKENLEALKESGCKRVFFLPFAYAPEIHFPQDSLTNTDRLEHDCDVLFIGGADRNRVPYFKALIQAGLKVHLYGQYWGRYGFKKQWRGFSDAETTRKAYQYAKISPCLVRRANRDGNSMRTFEIPAMRGCMLAEDTNDHRALFGEEGKAVFYFKTHQEMLKKTIALIGNPSERERLAHASHRLITEEKHTYQDRLLFMFSKLFE